MGLSHSPSIVTDGLVLCLDAANTRSYPKSGTSWLDLSGNGNNASLINGPTYSTNNSGQILFDGTNDRAEIVYPASSFVNTSFTWCVWLLGTVVNNGPMPIVGYGSGAWPRLGFSLRAQGWHFGQYGNNGTGNIDIYFGVQPSSTNWFQLVLTADYTNTKISGYVNGMLKTYTNNWRDSTGNYSTLGLGRAGSTGWPNALLQGSISGFTVYNRALSAEEVQRNYLATKSRFGL